MRLRERFPNLYYFTLQDKIVSPKLEYNVHTQTLREPNLQSLILSIARLQEPL